MILHVKINSESKILCNVRQKLVSWSDGGLVDVILTTGGTGFGPRDVTPEVNQISLFNLTLRRLSRICINDKFTLWVYFVLFASKNPNVWHRNTPITDLIPHFFRTYNDIWKYSIENFPKVYIFLEVSSFSGIFFWQPFWLFFLMDF